MKKDECRCCAVMRGENFDGKRVICDECRGNFSLREDFYYYCTLWRYARSMAVFLVVFPVFIILAVLNGIMFWWAIPVNAVLWAANGWWYWKKMRGQAKELKEKLFLRKLVFDRPD